MATYCQTSEQSTSDECQNIPPSTHLKAKKGAVNCKLKRNKGCNQDVFVPPESIQIALQNTIECSGGFSFFFKRQSDSIYR